MNISKCYLTIWWSVLYLYLFPQEIYFTIQKTLYQEMSNGRGKLCGCFGRSHVNSPASAAYQLI